MSATEHQMAEAALIEYALAFPQTDQARGWGTTRMVRVRKRGFAIFGEKGETAHTLTLTVKLPISAPMVQDLSFVRESRGWFKQHNWVIAHFGPDDDFRAEFETLRYWLRQSYVAMAPKKLGRLVETAGGETSG